MNPTFSLLARMAAVAAIGIVAVDQLNHVSTSIVLGDPVDVTEFAMAQVQTLAHVSSRLMALGTDVVAFIGLF